ncbi:MAG: hypothetical protein U9N33_05385 [Campylobacterota bacterium]|nr:hypothetical protein [Campylobacterota bacterium]
MNKTDEPSSSSRREFFKMTVSASAVAVATIVTSNTLLAVDDGNSIDHTKQESSLNVVGGLDSLLPNMQKYSH